MSLDISGTAIPIDKLPSTLQHLRFKLCPFKEAHGLPAALRSLDLSGAKGLTTIDLRSLAHLERLDISETSISDIPVLPATLLELDISNTPIRTLRNLPQGLRRLTVHGGQLRTLAGLPGTVTELYFQGSL